MKHLAHQFRGQLYAAEGGSGFIVRGAMMAVPGELKAQAGLLEESGRFLKWSSGGRFRQCCDNN